MEKSPGHGAGSSERPQPEGKPRARISAPSMRTDGPLGCCQERGGEKSFDEEFLGFCRAKNREGRQAWGVCRQLRVQRERLRLGSLLLGSLHPGTESQRKEKETKIPLLRHKTQMRQTAGRMQRLQTFVSGKGLGEI